MIRYTTIKELKKSNGTILTTNFSFYFTVRLVQLVVFRRRVFSVCLDVFWLDLGK